MLAIVQRLQSLLSQLVARLQSILLRRNVFCPPSLDDLAAEVHRLCATPLGHHRSLIAMSDQIRDQLRAALHTSPVCMLPSYTHALPTGTEQGTFLAVDVGGSTFRVALVQLHGRGRVSVVRESAAVIDNPVKALDGSRFFDWMAARIDAMLRLVDPSYGRDPSQPLSMGLSWSFPVEQTAVNTGLVIHMGKGFRGSNGTVGHELGGLIADACRRRHLHVHMDAIVNDGAATLLSRAYVNPQTRMSLILGTGTNVAVHFPVDAIGRAKFGVRPSAWFDIAQNVVVNSELSMFGGAGVLPRTRWDDCLNRAHLRPDYQPLEYMITGRYLDEVVRLILVEAVETASLFNGELPRSLWEPYSLDTSLVAFLEADPSPSLASAAALLQKQHTFAQSPSTEDLMFLRSVCQAVSRRAAAYLAIAIHSMWCLRNEVDPLLQQNHLQQRNLAIACDGSVINKYPGFRQRCQDYLDQLTDRSVTLELAPESAILGAAVAVAVAVS